MSKKGCIILFTLFLLSDAVPVTSLAQPLEYAKISTQYATVSYQDKTLLRLFNKRIKLRSMGYLMKRGGSIQLSLEGDVSRKIDIIVERVETILGMWPKNFKVHIFVMRTANDVQTLYKKKYLRESNFLAFYAPLEKSIYISADDAESIVLAHELAHAVIDQYFTETASLKIHELLSDYVTEHLEE